MKRIGVIMFLLLIGEICLVAQNLCVNAAMDGCFDDSARDNFLAQHPGASCSPPPPVGCYRICSFVALSCSATPQPPAGAVQETTPTCSGCIAGKPIDLATGNTYIEQNDISVPGLGGGLHLYRKWNSLWPASQAAFASGYFGSNWRSNFEERVFVGSDGTMKYSRSD